MCVWAFCRREGPRRGLLEEEEVNYGEWLQLQLNSFLFFCTPPRRHRQLEPSPSPPRRGSNAERRRRTKRGRPVACMFPPFQSPSSASSRATFPDLRVGEGTATLSSISVASSSRSARLVNSADLRLFLLHIQKINEVLPKGLLLFCDDEVQGKFSPRRIIC